MSDETLTKRVRAAFWLGINGPGLSTKARATERVVVLTAYYIGRMAVGWRRDVPRAVSRAVGALLDVLLTVLFTLTSPIAVPLYALYDRKQARKEVEEYDALKAGRAMKEGVGR